MSASLALLALAGAPGAPAATVTCDQTITQNTTVDNDLTCNGVDGLTIGASNVTLDLGGHTIRDVGPDDANGLGIHVLPGAVGVTIKNGVVQDFTNGVLVEADSTRVLRLGVIGSFGAAIETTASGSLVRDNLVSGGQVGIFAQLGSDVRMIGNAVAGNTGAAVVVQGTRGARIRRNWLTHSFHGLEIGPRCTRPGVPESCTFATNTIARANQVRRNLGDGIQVLAGIGDQPSGTLLWDNVTSRNGRDGIVVLAPHTTLLGNRAFFNANYGINAVQGVQDGGGNRAANNGNPAQCLNIACMP